MTKQEYYSKIEALVSEAKNYLRTRFEGKDPEEATKQHLIEPLLEALGYDAKGEFYLDNVDVGGVTLKPDFEKLGLPFLLALLNSRLLRWYFPSVSAPFHSGFFSANRQFLSQVPIKLPKSKAETTLAAKIHKLVKKVQAAHGNRSALPAALNKQIAHSSNRAPCSLAHYIQADYANTIKAEKLIDDVQRKGFVTSIAVQSDKNTVTITAAVADTKQAAPVAVPILRLTFTNAPLQQFVYASWQGFLAANSRKKAWTPGKTPQLVYDFIVNGLEPLVFFLPDAADNLSVIRDVIKAVAKEAGTADLAAVESEIAETDIAINELVYKLYDLTSEEIALVESVATLTK
jgi:hypothetical protein